MKILSLSQDPEIAQFQSEAYDRMRAYARALGELHIVVPVAAAPRKYEDNLFVYPAAGRFLIARRWRVFWIARALLASHLASGAGFAMISVQGPDEIGLMGLVLSRAFRIPLHVQVHTDIGSPWYRRSCAKARIRFWIARFLLPRASCIRVVSARIKRYLVDSLGCAPDRIRVLPLIPAAFYDARSADALGDSARSGAKKGFRMIAVGRFVDREKNFSLLIRLMRSFTKIAPDAVLLLVGDGPSRSRYARLIRSFGLESRVRLIAWQRDLTLLYQSSDVLLIPSYYEGWGRVAIEGIAAGVPVVMTDVGLAGEIILDEVSGLVVPVGNRNEFEKAVARLWRDPALRRRLAIAAAAVIKQELPRTWDEYIERYRETFMACNGTITKLGINA